MFAILVYVVDCCGGKGCHRPFHVGGAATVDVAALYLGGKGLKQPVSFIAGWHNISMAGKTQVRFSCTDAGKEIFDVGCVVVLEDQALTNKTILAEEIFEHSQGALFMGRYGTAANEISKDGNGIGWGVFHSVQHRAKKYARRDGPGDFGSELVFRQSDRCRNCSVLRFRAGNRAQPISR